jgi:hypothetical protein
MESQFRSENKLKMTVFCDVRSVIWQKFTDVSEVSAASNVRAMIRPQGATPQMTVILIPAAVRN